MACGLLERWENIKEETSVKKHGFLLTITTLLLVLIFFVCGPQPGTFGAKAYAKESHSQSKIISDTLVAHEITCLSRDGSIMTVLLDGKWVDVREVELVGRTLIIRTNAGTLSLAAVINK
jgi:hypothetical protein